MPTKLDKDLVRESTVMVDGREILVTLSADQRIKMKLKGMKSGEASIDIGRLFSQLTGGNEDDLEDITVNRSLSIITDDDKPSKSAILIDLEDLRSMNAISMLDITTLSKFDGIIADLIKQKKEIKQATSAANRPMAKVTKKKK